ncbi:HSP20-like chaperone [Ceratobasidium sp. AG-I]|nr:HSP20-like chaperone [Ceratobasidium sp. AG-I]
MSLAHFLHEYSHHQFLGPYYEHWLTDSNFGTFGHVWRPDWSEFHPEERRPPVEWHEDETLYTIHLEVPGVKREDMNMYVTDDGRSLKIEGKIEKFGGAAGLGLGSTEDTKDRATRIKKVRKTMVDGTVVIISRLEKKHTTGSSVKFTRSVTLPGNVDGKRVAARLEDGILTVTIPKLSSPKPRRIVIN